MCESPANTQNLYVGTSDGLVWSTTNGGTTWNNVTSTLPNRYVTSVKASQINPNVAYVTHSGYKDNDNIPHVHKTTNNGTTWTDISGDLPQIAVNCIMTYAGTDNILFLGTDGGVYGTINGGTNWIRIGNNMPVIPTYDLELDPNANKLLAGTFARSLMSYPMDSILLMTGMNMIVSDISLNIYPNPAADFIKVNLSKKYIDATLTIFNQIGEIVNTTNLISSNQINIPIGNLASGIYFLRIESENGIRTRRFVKL